MRRARLEDLAGGNAAENAEIIRAILRGEKSPRRDVVLLNAAAALVAAAKAEHLVEAVRLATRALDSGAAATKLSALIQFTSTHPEP
jgi:anthranilate phosphoribosyltransferase